MSSDDHNGDYEEVFRVLPEQFRSNWKDNPDVLVYLADLGSLGLQRLSQEPDRLLEERSSVLEQTQDLAFHNYKTFIQAAECSNKIFQDFNIIETRLDSMVDKLPEFKDKCGEFGKEAQKINARWRQASSTLGKHPQLLEFLEMPQLMDTYVRSGFYDEALELSAYVKRLERKHAADIPLIRSIVSDVQASSNAMLQLLLGKLRTNLKLPDCLKVVGYLRRLDAFNEQELRVKFLQARDAWFQKVVNEIDRNDPYEHSVKIIESARVHLFDITTQYRAIFSDDDPLLLVRDDCKGNCAIFHSWIAWKISWFLCILEQDISQDLGGRIDSVLAQCMYFGLSFSRVNIDFRSLLVPLFQNVALKKLCAALDRATGRFESTMETFTFSTYTNTAFVVPGLSEETMQPPIALLDFHPLAQYLNDVLTALNDLKLCCSYSMANDVIAAVTSSLDRLVKTLTKVHSKWKKRLNEVETENFNKLCLLFSTDLVPHIDKCLTSIFPSEQIAQSLGIASLEFKKLEYLCKLNVDAILEPLQEILPKIEDEDYLVIKIHDKERLEGSGTEKDASKKVVDPESHLKESSSIESGKASEIKIHDKEDWQSSVSDAETKKDVSNVEEGEGKATEIQIHDKDLEGSGLPESDIETKKEVTKTEDWESHSKESSSIGEGKLTAIGQSSSAVPIKYYMPSQITDIPKQEISESNDFTILEENKVILETDVSESQNT
ncbi:hypothetical protein JTE90_025149 [Oedothorax gibbosus]|uniref:Conserved oligomeric Golgi complex subunit 8 n=1 Tax=Oedothorax gibbosus TaxID=931172 RepID=A0AAV6UH13_9ARAC|nr:hypothetical protein JTE90_025149 [Oedothorax gibbosus]